MKDRASLLFLLLAISIQGTCAISVPKHGELSIEPDVDKLVDLMIAAGAQDRKAAKGDEDKAEQDNKPLEPAAEELRPAVKEWLDTLASRGNQSKSNERWGIVWVHGAAFSDWAPLFTAMLDTSAGPVVMKFPIAPIHHVHAWGFNWMGDLAPKGVSWFDMWKLPIGEEDAGEDMNYGCKLDEAEDHLHTIIEAIESLEKEGVSSERIIVAGFSQGGEMALLAGTQYPKKLAGIYVGSGMLMNPAKLMNRTSEANQAIPIEWLHGTFDSVLLPSMQAVGVAALAGAGFPISTANFIGGHWASLALFQNIGDFAYKVT